VEHLDRIRDPNQLGAWLATTARRKSLRLLRSAAREGPSYDPDADMQLAEVESAEARAILSDQSVRIWRAFVNLPSNVSASSGPCSPCPRRATPRWPRRSTCRSAASVRPGCAA
jgi:hypothetical protein